MSNATIRNKSQLYYFDLQGVVYCSTCSSGALVKFMSNFCLFNVFFLIVQEAECRQQNLLSTAEMYDIII